MTDPRNTVLRKPAVTVCMIACVILCFNYSAFTQKQHACHVTPPRLLYTDDAMDDVEKAFGIDTLGCWDHYDPAIDQPLWGLKRKDGTLRFCYQWLWHISFHEGTITSFFENVIPDPVGWCGYDRNKPIRNTQDPQYKITGTPDPLKWHFEWTGEGIANVCRLPNSDNEFLGFVHVERVYRKVTDPGTGLQDRQYVIGIAYSDDTCNTWNYCGDVIRPYYDVLGDLVEYAVKDKQSVSYFHPSNIGGVAYTVHNDYLYIYYNESTGIKPRAYPSVARARFDRVIRNARNSSARSTDWRKLDTNGEFSIRYNGKGEVLPGFPEPPDTGHGDLFIDMHCDAAYCSYIGRDILAVNWVDFSNGCPVSSIQLFSSEDGVQWDLEDTVAYPPDRMTYVYPSIISPFPDATTDNREVGQEFYVLFAGRPWNDGTLCTADAFTTDLFSVHVKVTAATGD